MVGKHKYNQCNVQFALPYSLVQTDFDGTKTFTEMDLAAKP